VPREDIGGVRRLERDASDLPDLQVVAFARLDDVVGDVR
jgi:hypothetical protein